MQEKQIIIGQEEGSPGLSLEELQGRQSVRATFRLPVDLIELFILLASQFGLKQKSLFDQLVDDHSILHQVVTGATARKRADGERRAKTLVVSKRSLELLERVAREQNVPRDLLVELSLRRLLPLLDQERDRHRRRVEATTEARAFFVQGEELLRRVERFLGREDQVHDLVATMVGQCQDICSRLEGIVEKGESVLRFRAGDGRTPANRPERPSGKGSANEDKADAAGGSVAQHGGKR